MAVSLPQGHALVRICPPLTGVCLQHCLVAQRSICRVCFSPVRFLWLSICGLAIGNTRSPSRSRYVLAFLFHTSQCCGAGRGPRCHSRTTLCGLAESHTFPRKQLLSG